MNDHQGRWRTSHTGMHSEGGNTDTRERQNLIQWSCSDDTEHKHRQVAPVSPLGPQRLSPQLYLESELWRRPRDHDGLGLRGLSEAVVLPLVLLVFFVFPLVNAVQARAAFTCRGEESSNRYITSVSITHSCTSVCQRVQSVQPHHKY